MFRKKYPAKVDYCHDGLDTMIEVCTYYRQSIRENFYDILKESESEVSKSDYTSDE